MARRWFGTDGVRGRVGEAPITADWVVRLGRAAGTVLGAGTDQPTVLIGKDTRVSGYMLESALEAGLAAAGTRVVLLGPMPTPGVARLTCELGAQAGAVISASHNPFADNGIKFFDGKGAKLDDAIEHAIEEEIERPFTTVAPEKLGKARRLDDAVARYASFCESTVGSLESLRGMRVVVDCANGAAYQVAPRVFAELGFDVVAVANQPDGFNINAGCGATDLSLLKRAVPEHQATLGFALDGDGDRLMIVDAAGRVIDGDDMLYLLACDWRARGRLRGPVVGTVMTNLGIEQALGRREVPFERAAVGDRYVLQRLNECGGMLGGEASGHVLCLDRATTGDAIVTALQVLEVLARGERDVSRLLEDVVRFPQRMINVRTAAGARPLEDAAVRSAAAEVERALGSRGRLILRASGTEPLVRVTVEAETRELTDRCASELAAVVERHAGLS